METREVRNAAIRVEDLVKTFKDVRAVDGVSFTVEEGELFAFLGENGAGKSTCIAVLCGLLQKDGGKVYVAGQDVEANDSAKSRIGVVFQNSVLDKALSARDNLFSRAALYNIVGKAFKQRLAELDGLLHFNEFIDRPLNRLSGGQKRKIDIARALLHKPEILILDEPTTGLDPQTRRTVWEAVQKLQKEENMTVFLTTHYMEEAAKADYVVILDHGKVEAEGTPLTLKNRYTGDFIVLYKTSREAAISVLGEEWEA
ncbi:MAG: ABC transporter ATP-binding protein, partial [Candidatus Scatosoma sp.]